MDIFFCVRFSEPKFFFQSTIYVLHDGYFLSPIFGLQFFFQSTIYKLWPMMDIFWIQYLALRSWIYYQHLQFYTYTYTLLISN